MSKLEPIRRCICGSDECEELRLRVNQLGSDGRLMESPARFWLADSGFLTIRCRVVCQNNATKSQFCALALRKACDIQLKIPEKKKKNQSYLVARQHFSPSLLMSFRKRNTPLTAQQAYEFDRMDNSIEENVDECLLNVNTRIGPLLSDIGTEDERIHKIIAHIKDLYVQAPSFPITLGKNMCDAISMVVTSIPTSLSPLLKQRALQTIHDSLDVRSNNNPENRDNRQLQQAVEVLFNNVESHSMFIGDGMYINKCTGNSVSSDCGLWLVSKTCMHAGFLCDSCTSELRNTNRREAYKRKSNTDSTHPSSHTPLSLCSPNTKRLRMVNVHKQLKVLRKTLYMQIKKKTLPVETPQCEQDMILSFPILANVSATVRRMEPNSKSESYI